MMHPAFQGRWRLAVALTPVYPTVAGLPQAYLRRAVQVGWHAPSWRTPCPLRFALKLACSLVEYA